MKLIVGLGNPGKKYINTRHNVGFLFLDKLIKELSVASHISKKLQVIYYLVDQRIILAKPQDFMNSSGKVVKKLLEKFKVPLDDLIVVHDDIDLPLGKYKISRGQGSAGHQGIQSIIDELLSKDFTRIRIGVGRPPFYLPAETYVLQNFSEEEWEGLSPVFSEVAERIKSMPSDPEFRNIEKLSQS